MNEENSYGKKIEFDPRWQGPLQKSRSTTDFYCFIILAIFLVVWLIVAVFAFTTGSINNLLPPIDSDGRRCGIDVEVKNQKYLLFFDITKCNNGTCPTTQSCLSECPKSNFLYKKGDGDIKDVKSKLICKTGIDPQSINSWDVLDNYIQGEKCARMYIESKSIFKRCIPKGVPAEFKNKISNETIAKIEEFVSLQVAKENVLAEILRGFSNTKYKIIGFIILSIVLSMAYLFAMRWFTKFFVYTTIFLVCALIFYFICQAAMVYSSDKNRTDALAGLIISVIALVLVILFTIFFWRKINIACEVIKESCKAVISLPSTLVFPILAFILYALIVLIGGMITLYLTTIKEDTFKVNLTKDGCTCPESLHYDNGAFCDPNIFMKECKIGKVNSCFESGCRFTNATTPNYVHFLHGINGFGFLWSMFFISAFAHMVLAGTFATWYWTMNKKFVPKFALFNFMGITIRYHLGSLALGSLILTITRFINQMIESLKNNSGNRNTWLEILSCIVDAIESALKFLTRYTYILIALHGRNFFKSAKDSFNLLMRNILHVLVINKITDWILLFGVFLITGLTVTFTWLSCRSYLHNDADNGKGTTEMLILLLTTGLGSCLIASMIVKVLKTAIDTIFICFLEDSERNDGSEEKPYFMPFKLRELLQK